jgi:hypothetical protein
LNKVNLIKSDQTINSTLKKDTLRNRKEILLTPVIGTKIANSKALKPSKLKIKS